MRTAGETQRVARATGRKRLPRAVREQQMLDAAVAVFSAAGFHDASMDEIAARAGISKPMVYAYLGSKEELFLACLHREGTRLMEAVASAVAPADAPPLPPDEQLWRGLRAFFAFVGAHRDGWRVLYRQARGTEPFVAELAAMRARMVDVVCGLLSRVIAASGRSPRPVDVTAMAYALVGAGESLADWAVDHSEEPPETTATRLMNFVWLGAGELLGGAVWRPSTVD
jgi:AcrR family transcriptional regulator